jgi:hypothetical protein
MNSARARRLIMAIPGTIAAPHFDREAFRAGGRIFATLRSADGVLNVKLAPEIMETMCAAEPRIFSPVPGGWGRMGWTTINLAAAGETELRSALDAALTESRVKPPKAAKKR